MKLVVAIVAQGAMGAGIALRLVENGATVLTSLEGRSVASAARAASAGMRDVPCGNLAEAGIILSIVPPGDAPSLAERLAPALRSAAVKPLYVDCNAVHPGTAARIGAMVTATGAAFADGGIIGGPPQQGKPGPALYVSGPAAPRVQVLGDCGLDIRVLDGPPEAASALKMSYAGITKGLTALASVMMLAAARAGTADALKRELAESQPALLAWFGRMVPGMYTKAYRWVAEMEEIAAFVGDDPQARQYFEAAAELYARLAADNDGDRREVETLTAFLR